MWFHEYFTVLPNSSFMGWFGDAKGVCGCGWTEGAKTFPSCCMDVCRQNAYCFTLKGPLSIRSSL